MHFEYKLGSDRSSGSMSLRICLELIRHELLQHPKVFLLLKMGFKLQVILQNENEMRHENGNAFKKKYVICTLTHSYNRQ